MIRGRLSLDDASAILLLALCATASFACERRENTAPTPTALESRERDIQSSSPRTLNQPGLSPVPEIVVHELPHGTRIDIDGKLDESSWKTASSLKFNDASTGQPNARLPVNGSVRLLWSREGFYVGFEVADSDVTGGFEPTRHDPHLWTRDTVEIMVDPDGDGDNRDYYEVQIGPQNLVFDTRFDDYNAPVTLPDGPFGHEQWSSGVKSSVTVRGSLDQPHDVDEGYVVEALLPWISFGKAKKIPPAPGDTWRMNFYAIERNSGASWSPILGVGNFHKASRFGRVRWGN